jgi:GTP-dependent phosphoenolpyruvate carboxykinase
MLGQRTTAAISSGRRTYVRFSPLALRLSAVGDMSRCFFPVTVFEYFMSFASKYNGPRILDKKIPAFKVASNESKILKGASA